MRELVDMYATYVKARLNVKSELGAAGVEYGLLVALIAAVIVVTVKSVGTKTKAGFVTVDGALP